ncbi:MAG: pentapeptide repeat-containing protein, partial [Halobacteria archaeon]|nr:pentapeptide repeat-containing protein [Halobacteria archaeon]
MSEDAPEGVCGYTVEEYEIHSYSNNICCIRETWRNYDYCIWHADVKNKPVDELKEWHANEPERIVDAKLRDIYAKETDFLSEIDLPRGDLSESDLMNADLSNIDLNNANLSDANLRSANLFGTNLYLANLSDAHLRRADLSQANLSG